MSANVELGWKPKYDFDTIVKTAYNWYKEKEDNDYATIKEQTLGKSYPCN